MKTGSGKHIQKNGVVYKVKGASQAKERAEVNDKYRESIVNTAVTRRIKSTDAAYQK